MVLSDDNDEDIRKRHQELCVNLNMDKDASDEAWNNYEVIRHNYTLEGDQLHWLGCALYVACRKSTIPTVGTSGSTVEGNCVSLTRLLQLCSLNLIQFLDKSKKWAGMASLPTEFRAKIDRLERNFAVSMVIFKKFHPIFIDIFHNPAEEQPKVPRSRKHRGAVCTPAKLFDLCWTLFVCVKGELPDISDDLVNSFHLLLACCDYVFGNAVLAKRRDLLVPEFPGLPHDFSSEHFQPPSASPCIIDLLCAKHEGIPLEAKGIKAYCWKERVQRLFEKKVLRGDPNTLSGILEPAVFEANYKAVTKAYEEYVLSVGDFDERIFLGEDADSEIGTPTKLSKEFEHEMQAKKNLISQFTGIKHLTPSTPLTGRKYLPTKELQSNVTPVSTATQSVSRLQTILAGRQNAPSEMLCEIFKACNPDPTEKIDERIKELGSFFCTRYTQTTDDYCGPHIDFARKRLTLAESFYYKLLESIIIDEKKKKPTGDFINPLLAQDIFHQTLFACSLEIVIYSYNSQKVFPWVLEALNIEPYYFYKVIEIIVRVEDQLSRDMVKHLNLIEEQILEAMAWRTESPLWENIKVSGQGVPSCEDVCLPGQLDDHMAKASCPNPAIRRLMGPTGQNNNHQSPVSTASERFQSPVQTGLAKKRLFNDTAVVRSVVRPGQSLLNTNPKTVNINLPSIKDNGGQCIPVKYISNSVIIQTQQPVKQQVTSGQEKETKAKPKRGGSLALFFRKFYHLASVRMQELCSHLNVTDMELKRKIWTCFEHSIIQYTDLMQDRHLDQLLMCAVYVICKVSGQERNFTEIMRCYRMQPQCASHVYRSVLLCSRRSGSGSSSNASPTPSDTENKDDRVRSSSTLPNTQPSSAPPTPTHMAGTSASFEFEDRGDLIKFYNTVYVQRVQAFALRFSSKNQQSENMTLSPLPLGKNQPLSPKRRIAENFPVFIRSLEPRILSPTNNVNPLSYCFSRSPAKDLRAINNMIQVDSHKVSKRLLVDDSEADAPPVKVVARKLQNIIGDRDRLGHSQD